RRLPIRPSLSPITTRLVSDLPAIENSGAIKQTIEIHALAPSQTRSWRRAQFTGSPTLLPRSHPKKLLAHTISYYSHLVRRQPDFLPPSSLKLPMLSAGAPILADG